MHTHIWSLDLLTHDATWWTGWLWKNREKKSSRHVKLNVTWDDDLMYDVPLDTHKRWDVVCHDRPPPSKSMWGSNNNTNNSDHHVSNSHVNCYPHHCLIHHNKFLPPLLLIVKYHVIMKSQMMLIFTPVVMRGVLFSLIVRIIRTFHTLGYFCWQSTACGRSREERTHRGSLLW